MDDDRTMMVDQEQIPYSQTQPPQFQSAPQTGYPQQPDMGMPQQPVNPGMTQMPDMNMAPQQPVQPDMNMTQMPQQPVQPEMNMTQMPQQPVQPDMNMTQMPQQPVQPDMNMTQMPQQPVQPDMGMAPQQPVNPDMTQPVQPDMNMTQMPQQPVQPDMNMTQMPQQPVQPNMGMPQMPQQPQQNFGQPVMGMQAGMMYGQQPGMPQMPPQPGQTKAKKAKKPKKPKKPLTGGQKAGIIVASVLLIAAIVCGVIFIPKFLKSDREKVLDAYEATFDTYQVSEALEDVDMEAIQKALQENGGEISSNYTMNIMDGDETIKMAQTSAYILDQKNKLMSGNSVFTVGNTEVLTIDVFGDETNTYYDVPDLFDGYLGIPNQNPLGAIVDSPYGQQYGLAEELGAYYSSMANYSIDYFGGNTGSDVTNMELNSGYVSALETLWDKAEFKKQGRAKIDVNGKTMTAKEYYITFKKDDIKEALTAAIDGMMEDMLSSGEDLGISESELETTIQQMKAMLPTLIQKDFIVKVYIKDKKVVKTVCKGDISLYGVASISYDFWMDTTENDFTINLGFGAMGQNLSVKLEAYDLKGNTNGKLTISVPSEAPVELAFNKTVTTSGSVTTSVYTASLPNGFDAEMTTHYDSANMTFDGEGSVKVPGNSETLRFSYSGKCQTTKGVSYSFIFDSLSLKLDDTEILKMTMDFGVDTSKNTAIAMDGSRKKYMIAEMTETDWENLFADNKDKIEAWLEKVKNEPFMADLLDAFASEPVVDDEEYEDAYEWEEPEVSADDAVLSAGGISVKILGTIDGFELYGIFGNSVGFETDEYSNITYYLVEADSAQDALEANFASVGDAEFTETAYNQEQEVDGVTVLYSEEAYNMYEMAVMRVSAVTEVSPGVYVVIDSCIYTDDDSYTLEQVLQALSPSYYEVAQ